MKDHHRMRAWFNGQYWYWDQSKDEWNNEHGESQLGSFMNERGALFELCTCLRDKNGVLIYEGDILNCPIWWWGPGFVYLNRGVCGPCSGDSVMSYILAKDIKNPQKGASYNIWNGADVEVIGNIHQNPELLKAQ